jgi:integrase
MPQQDSLPSGVDRLKSGSLRVRVRLLGYPDEVKSFPLFEDTSEAKRRQLQDALAWQSAMMVRMSAGTHISTKEAERLTLRDALEMLRDHGLADRRPISQEVAKSQIGVLLRDPISDLPLHCISEPDVAGLRDRLIERGRDRSRLAAIKKLSAQEPNRLVERRMSDLNRLPLLRRDPANRKLVAEIESLEGIRDPAPSTVKNTIQLVNRALKAMRERVQGVSAPIYGIRMPSATPGRSRRLGPGEFDALLKAATEVNPLAGLIIRFAILTALRRERCLSIRLSNIEDVGNGDQMIKFPQDVRAKRTGIAPVTKEIRSILDAAMKGRDLKGENDPLIFNVPVETFERWFERSIAAAGLKDFRFHDLRHEATSRLFEDGLTTAEVMSVTGHSTNDMVDRYSHYSAVIVLRKMEARQATSLDLMLEQICEQVTRFKRLGGDLTALKDALDGEVQ